MEHSQGERILLGDPEYMIVEILVNGALNPVVRQLSLYVINSSFIIVNLGEEKPSYIYSVQSATTTTYPRSLKKRTPL